MTQRRQIALAAASLVMGLATLPLAALAQGTIKIGEVNSYKAQPAFLEPRSEERRVGKEC